MQDCAKRLRLQKLFKSPINPIKEYNINNHSCSYVMRQLIKDWEKVSHKDALYQQPSNSIEFLGGFFANNSSIDASWVLYISYRFWIFYINTPPNPPTNIIMQTPHFQNIRIMQTRHPYTQNLMSKFPYEILHLCSLVFTYLHLLVTYIYVHMHSLELQKYENLNN